MQYYLIFFSFLVCLGLTPLVRLVAVKKGWMAYPTKERWHKKPTALFGGCAIYAAVSIPLLIVADFRTIWPHIIRVSEGLELPSIGAAIWIGMTFLFILGLLDDIYRIKPQTKLVGQILIASIISFLGFRLHWFISPTLDTLITIIWVIGITNAFNLLDNMDGLCAGIGFIAAVFLSLLFAGLNPEAMFVAMITAGALAAFLIYNFNPASIFMGDSGSLVIGFILAVLSLYFSETEPYNALSFYAVPIMLLLVPIFDTTMVTLVRLLSGRKASMGGKDHTSHRFVLMGFSEKRAVMFLYGIGVISGLSALFVSRSDAPTSPVVIIPVILAAVLMGIYMAQIRVYPEKEFSILRDRPYTPILIELTYKRQLMLIILDFCLIVFCYYLSYRLRFSAEFFPYYFKVFLRSLPAIIACKFAAFFALGIYKGIWASMDSNDALLYLKASTLATILSVAVVTYIYRFVDFSKGAFFIDWLLTNAFLLGTRGSFKLFVDTIKRKTLEGQRVLIYGAGCGGELLLRELLNNNKLKIKPVGFIDDDMLKSGKNLRGYPILGDIQRLESLAKKHKIDGLLISFNHLDHVKHDAAKRLCQTNGLFLKQFSVSFKDVDPAL